MLIWCWFYCFITVPCNFYLLLYFQNYILYLVQCFICFISAPSFITFFKTQIHTYTSGHSLVFTSRCFVAAFNGGLCHSLCSRSVLSLSYQLLVEKKPNLSRPLNSPTKSADLNFPAYDISERTAQQNAVPLLK
jgi:hypothetical protein